MALLLAYLADGEVLSVFSG